MTAIMLGNYTGKVSGKNRFEDVPPGFDLFTLYGTLRLTNVAANNWDVLDDKDNTLTVPATALEPLWLAAISANIVLPTAPTQLITIAGTNGDVLKIGQSVADAVFVANSNPVAGSILAAQQIRSNQAPNAVTQITASATFRAFLHNGANAAPAGNLVITSIGAQARNFFRIPVEIFYLRRSAAVRIDELPSLSIAQQKLDGNIT